jgi:hypothetical protein
MVIMAAMVIVAARVMGIMEDAESGNPCATIEFRRNVTGLIYSGLGDFDRFYFHTNDEHEHNLKGCTSESKRLVTKAWTNRWVVTGCEQKDLECPITIVLKHPSSDLENFFLFLLNVSWLWEILDHAYSGSGRPTVRSGSLSSPQVEAAASHVRGLERNQRKTINRVKRLLRMLSMMQWRTHQSRSHHMPS